MANQWFRFYNEVLNDQKVQGLPANIFKIWVNALCLASSNDKSNGELGTLESVSFALRETKEAVSEAFQALIKLGIVETDNETFHISKWNKRQYKSDISTERVKRFRKRSETVSETPPDQNRSDSDQNRSDQSDFVSNEKKKFIFTPTEDTHSKTISLAVGWDRQALYNKFGDWVRTSAPQMPTDPQKAFLGWLPSFTAKHNRKHLRTFEQSAE